MTFDERVQKIKAIQRGWINYFRLANIQGKLKELDGWLRNCLRYCIWHRWKGRMRKRINLIRPGVRGGTERYNVLHVAESRESKCLSKCALRQCFLAEPSTRMYAANIIFE